MPRRDKSLTGDRQNANSQKQNCVLCGSNRLWEHHQRRTFEQNADFVNPIQFILSVDATRFIQYRVYNRTADLKMVHLITAADLYYRKKYYDKYSWKYERG